MLTAHGRHTVCIAQEPEFRIVLEEIRDLRLAA